MVLAGLGRERTEVPVRVVCDCMGCCAATTTCPALLCNRWMWYTAWAAVRESRRRFMRARGLRLPDDNTPAERSGMSIYRIYAGADGESHIEAVHLAQHAELGALMHVAQAGIHEFSTLRAMDFHPLPERRLIIHLRGEVEI